MEKIVLIDAYAQIYRGFYAVRYLANSKGEPTNAIFALIKFLMRVNNNSPSTFGAFIFDKGKPGFRLKLAPDYKANRSPMPDELRSQLDKIREVVELFGWPIHEREGYEADDVIAAIATYFTDNLVEIFSADKDLAQLVTSKVSMMVPDHKGGGISRRGVEEVKEKFSVTPEQILDYLALIGDSSDNIPGLRGVGPKTAVKLLNQFGCIDEMVKRSSEISNLKLREKIDCSEDLLKKNIELVRLNINIPNKIESTSLLIRKEPNWQGLLKFAEELELKSLFDSIKGMIIDKNEEVLSGDEDQQASAYTPDLFDCF